MVGGVTAIGIAHSMDMICEAHILVPRVEGIRDLLHAQLFLKDLGLEIHGSELSKDRFVVVQVAYNG